MRKLSMLLIPGVVTLALAAGPVLTNAYANGSDDPSPPKSDTSSKKKKKTSSIATPKFDSKFLAAYHTAYTTIYDRHDYADAITQLKALQRNDVADVVNLIGYSYRKLGDYKQSQVYYELALKDDPNHVRTWQYYGLWQLEQGNREQAEYHLNKIAALAGTDSEDYRALAAALNKPTGTALVY